MEPHFPLHVRVCSQCFLVQLPNTCSSETIFDEYAYFSSYSESWLQHAKIYVEMITKRFGISPRQQVVEVASNDGYLLQYFVKKGVPVLGIEPAKSIAKVAVKKGIETVIEYFGRNLACELAAQGFSADLLIGNNVLAHVPDLNDFIGGLKVLLKPRGIITIEFPHLLRLIQENQFDTIYHEHFSYFSFSTIFRIFKKHGLKIFDVDQLPVHGGSLRIYVCHDTENSYIVADRVGRMHALEKKRGINSIKTYKLFQEQVISAKCDILNFMVQAKRNGKKICAYGAPAKGNTLLNYCGIRTDFIEYTVDRNPYKQNHYLPGSQIKVFSPERIMHTKPDYLVILPWNLKNEIAEQMNEISRWGGKFVTLIPHVEVFGCNPAIPRNTDYCHEYVDSIRLKS